MATMATGAGLPRRLTQLFSDNKKSYEALVQTRQTGPELSPLHLKLRIQKDRLLAWGVQWSDRSTHAGDIDGSLDKAGISDLVSSIMCSIRELLDEAEQLHPHSQTLDFPRSSESKIALNVRQPVSAAEWTSANLKRLDEILKDLTTSIDTLCDLSRPRMEGLTPSDSSASVSKALKPDYARPKGAPPVRPISMEMKNARNSSPARRDDLTDMTYIDPSLLQVRAPHAGSSSSPPSYESIAAGSENRVMAYFSLPSSRSNSGFPSQDSAAETAVLLDYRSTYLQSYPRIPRPESARFEELLLALLKFSTWKANAYTGILKLTGWTIDTPKTRCAYVYEIPRSTDGTEHERLELQPRSLLSFLQNGGDADANNIPSLENRFRLSLNLSLSLMRLHEINVTHRNVNSNNILFFVKKSHQTRDERIWKGPVIRKPYLTGFHQLSSSSSAGEQGSSFLGLYYHPKLSTNPRATYDLVHDYYSLGLILLEIGLWMPIGKLLKSKYTMADFKARLQNIYLRKLSAKCGDGYMRAVLFCLTAADHMEHQTEMGLALTAEEHKQATDFEWNVIKPLERCCLIDSNVRSSEIIEAFTPDGLPTQPSPQDQPSGIASRGTSPGESSAISRQRSVSDKTTVAKTDTAQVAAKSCCKLKVWSHDIPSVYSKYWSSTMFPKLERILRKALSRWESYTIDLFMAGEDADTARPTIYMECASTAKVRKILRHLNKDFRFFDIKVVPGQIVRSKSKKRKPVKKAKDNAESSSMERTSSGEDLNPHYQPKPGCGASIGAYLNGNHLPPVTFGGAILIDNEPYGMSVHHMLEDDEEMQLALDDAMDMRRSMAPRLPAPKTGGDALASLQHQFAGLYPFEVSEPAEGDDASSTGYAYSDVSGAGFASNNRPEALYPYEIPDEDELDFGEASEQEDLDKEFWLDPDFDNASDVSNDEIDCDLGDTDGVSPGQGCDLLVTQPALDDVSDGFFPSVEDACSEHLSSHSLGHIHASSGLRRARDDTLIHEMDWALIKISPSRLPPRPHLNHPPHNSHQRFSAFGPPTSILPSDSLAARAVHSHARSSGSYARGTILPSMRLVRMPGRVSPSHSWQVRGNFGGGGDSGAWVFDDATGAVCGHVLAFSERSGVAYIAPMDVMLRDMERVLGRRVGLPGAGAGCASVDTSAAAAAAATGTVVGKRRSQSPPFPTSPPVVTRGLDEKGHGARVQQMEDYLAGMDVRAN